MSPLVIIWMIVLVDLMGFTLVMPLLPRFASDYGFNDIQIGMLLAAFPMAQLIAAPMLGRLSDRFGRRPVLAVSQFGTALSFLILGLSRDFTILLFARLLDGASGGNFLVAQAYVADITPPQDRAKGLGLIGAAFGIGFVLGPLLGGVLLELPVSRDLQVSLPFLVAAGFSTLAWVLVLRFLPESLSPDAKRRAPTRALTWRGLVEISRHPTWGLLVLVGALTTMAFAALDGTFSLFLKQRLGWSASRAAFGYAFLGFVSALVQGGLIRVLLRHFSESKLAMAGMLLLCLGLTAMANTNNNTELIVSSLLVGLGLGISSPSILGLLSRTTPVEQQGTVFGTLSSAQMLARMINYLVGNRLLGLYGPSAPYWEGAAIAGVALCITLAARGRLFQRPESRGPVADPASS